MKGRLVCLLREVSDSFADCELTHLPRTSIDVNLARNQHSIYAKALAKLGCSLNYAPALHGCPDAVFVEDTAIVLPKIAIAMRPGAESRRDEVPSVAKHLSRYRQIRHIVAPGTIDGGDVVIADRQIWVGKSSRSNAAGIDQLRSLVNPLGYQVDTIDTDQCLHLKSAITWLGNNTLLINPEWVDESLFSGYQLIRTDPAEAAAANVLRIDQALVCSTSFPRTNELLRKAGWQVEEVDNSEVLKAEGGVTCCSILITME